MTSVNEVVEWIIKNRTGCAFRGYTKELIFMQIFDSMKHGVLRVSQENGEIVGIVCGHRDDKKKLVFVDDILTTKRGVVKQFLKDCIQFFPGYMITGKVASGRVRLFKDQEKLLRRL